MRLGIVVLAVAVASLACASPSGRLDEYTRAQSGVPTSPSSVPGALEPTKGGVVERPCFDGSSDRCGQVLVPQEVDEEGPVRRIALGFRISQVDQPGRPVLLLTGSSPMFGLEDLDLPGRPLVELTNRGSWPSEPAVVCPEMAWLPVDADNDDWGDIIGRCSRRLTASGVAVGTYDSHHRAADTARAMALLGFGPVDVIAAGQAALDLAAVEDDSWIHAVLQVQPAAPGDPAVSIVAAQERILQQVWDVCAASSTCRLEGSVTDFLDVIAEFATDPLVLPTGATPAEERVMEDVDWVDLMLRDGHDPGAALFLPQLHGALRARDREWLAAYVEASSGSADAANFTSYCAGWLRSEFTGDEEAGLHPTLAAWIRDTREFVATFCDAWVPDLDVVPVDGLRTDALNLVAAGGPGADPAELIASGAQVVVAPTVARPGAACVSAAAMAWFDHARRTDDPSCAARPNVIDRHTPFELVAGHYEHPHAGSTLVVTTVVPDSWRDFGHGTWGREADPLDRTSLDIYLLTEMSPAGAQDWFLTGWELTDPVTERVAAGGRDWTIVTATDPWSADEQRYRAAFAREGGVVVGVILWAAATELEALTSTVMRPALEAIAVTG